MDQVCSLFDVSLCRRSLLSCRAPTVVFTFGQAGVRQVSKSDAVDNHHFLFLGFWFGFDDFEKLAKLVSLGLLGRVKLGIEFLDGWSVGDGKESLIIPFKPSGSNVAQVSSFPDVTPVDGPIESGSQVNWMRGFLELSEGWLQ